MSGRDLFVTGGAGFVGSHLVGEARRRGLDVHVSASDLRDPDAIEAEIAESAPARLAHLATSPRSPGEDPWELLQAELAMAGNVLRGLASAAAGARALLVGSAAQYGMGAPGPLSEDAPLRPLSAYGAIKTALEAACTATPFAGDVAVVWARSFNHLGPGQPPSAPVASWARQIALVESGAGERVRTGHLDPVRDFLDVRDVASAYLALLDSDATGVFNVCSGAGVALRDVLDELIRMSPGEVPVATDSALLRGEDPPAVVGDPRRLRDATGWAPGYGLRDSLAAVLDDWRSRVREEGNDRRDAEATWKA